MNGKPPITPRRPGPVPTRITVSPRCGHRFHIIVPGGLENAAREESHHKLCPRCFNILKRRLDECRNKGLEIPERPEDLVLLMRETKNEAEYDMLLEDICRRVSVKKAPTGSPST